MEGPLLMAALPTQKLRLVDSIFLFVFLFDATFTIIQESQFDFEFDLDLLIFDQALVLILRNLGQSFHLHAFIASYELKFHF